MIVTRQLIPGSSLPLKSQFSREPIIGIDGPVSAHQQRPCRGNLEKRSERSRRTNQRACVAHAPGGEDKNGRRDREPQARDCQHDPR